MFYTLERHEKGYSISNWDIILTAATGCSGAFYSIRHVDLACRPSTTSSWGHWVIAAIEFLPLVGALAALVERIVAFIYKLFLSAQPVQPVDQPAQPVKLVEPAKPVYSLIPNIFSIVSAYLPSDEALSLNGLFPGMFFGERTSLRVSAELIDTLENELRDRNNYGAHKILSLAISIGYFSSQKPSAQRIIDFIRKFPQLEHLDLSCCHIDLYFIAQNCPSLQSLNLRRCTNLTDAALLAFAKHCPDLQSLDVAWCGNLTDAALFALAQHCPDLQSLDVSLSSWLTDAGLISLAQNCRGLQSLKVSGCAKLTDAALLALAQNCRSLQSLNIGWCDKLTDATLFALAQNCQGLQSLKVWGCRNFTDLALSTIAQRCTGLQSLAIGGCNQLTDAALLAFAQNCRGLRSLCITDNQFGAAAIKNLSDQRPDLRIFRLPSFSYP